MAFGANQHGQLGHGSVFEAKSSTLVSNLQPCVNTLMVDVLNVNVGDPL